ncbi:hypothetical protein C8J56DRAFT_891367 [Mycena floridula]|nr:hypothetical protein C8J56DRAFT_891316 [Mycena floridula]KAJ7586470.1 hypothetical protein C8J56DRAFT_891367 [Mycena floridula]
MTETGGLFGLVSATGGWPLSHWSFMDGGRFDHDSCKRDMIFNTRHGSADAHIMDSGRFQKDAFNRAGFNNKDVYADACFMHGGRLLHDAPIETALMIDMAIMMLMAGDPNRVHTKGAVLPSRSLIETQFRCQMIPVSSPGNGEAMMTFTDMGSQGFSMTHNGNQFTCSTNNMASTSGFGVRTVNDQAQTTSGAAKLIDSVDLQADEIARV